MEETLWHKFNQHEDLKQELLGTGAAELIEVRPITYSRADADTKIP